MKKIILGTLLATSVALGEGATVETSQSLFTNFSAMLDIRPTLTGGSDALVTENSYSINYQLTPDTMVGWLHYFNTNLSGGNGPDGGLGLRSSNAYVRAKFKNLWVSDNGQWDFAIQPRAYLPLDASDRKDSYVGSLRTYFDLRRKITPSFALVGSFIPIVHAYSNATKADGLEANKAIEFRYYVTAVAALADKLSLVFPLKLKQSVYRNAGAGVADSGAWRYKLQLTPELFYAIDENFSVGLGYETASFVKGDLSGLSVGDALESGKAQVILQASI